MSSSKNTDGNENQKGFCRLKKKVTNEIDWEDENIKLWKETAEEKQAFYCVTLGNKLWEEYTNGQEVFLQVKVGFSLYGPPIDVDDDALDVPDNEENIGKALMKFFEEPRKKRLINRITDLIKKHWSTEKVCIAFIFVIAWINDKYTEFPVIRLRRGKNDDGSDIVSFIDSFGRFYDTWENFLKNNDYSNCIYCYPTDGYYSIADDKVSLEFGRSPKGKIIKKLLKNLDTASNLAGFGSAALLVAGALFPISAPIVAGAAATGITTGVWATYRTLTEMVDRKQHSQSLSILDPGGRNCWIALAAGILGTASSGALKFTNLLAKNGSIITKVIDISSIGINSLGIINHVFHFVQDTGIRNGTGLALSILFFCHCTMTLRTAKDVILEIEHKVNIDVDAQLTPEQQALFVNLLTESRKCGLLEGNRKNIKSLKFIKNKDSFFKEISA